MSEEENLDAVLDPSTPPRKGRAPKANIVGQAVAAPQPEGQQVISSRAKIADGLDAGPPIRMRVTAKGHGQISAGSDLGFDRYARFVEFVAPERSARDLFNKGYAEPLDEPDATILRWQREDALEARRDAASLKARDAMLEHGAPVGQEARWNG